METYIFEEMLHLDVSAEELDAVKEQQRNWMLSKNMATCVVVFRHHLYFYSLIRMKRRNFTKYTNNSVH
jgi:hypothetical protein